MFEFSLVEVPKDRAELLRRQKVVERSMNAALRARTKRIRADMIDAIERGLRRIWGTGKDVKEVADNEATYGPDGLTKMKFVLGRWKQAFLDQAAHFYKDFSAAELKELLKMRSKYSRDPINWQHIQKLLSVDDKRARGQLIKRLCENDWSPEELAEAIDRLRGKAVGDRHPGGRPVAIPPHLTGRLANFEKVGKIVVRNAGAIYRHPEYGFVRSVQNLPPDRITTDLIDKIDRDITVAAQVRDTAQDVLNELEEARRLAERRSAEHVAQSAAKTAAAIDTQFSEKATKALEDRSKAGNGKVGKPVAAKVKAR
jgi:hypothetical protein